MNIVGISNVGRQKLMSFAIGGAWISDEKLLAFALIADGRSDLEAGLKKGLESSLWTMQRPH